MLQKITKFDKKISNHIIELDKKYLSWILYPCAAFFHPKLIWIAYILVFYFSGFDLHATLIYLMGTGICLLTTYILKRFTRRARPNLLEKVKKAHHFRKKEKNNSMPSGDAIQSALFTNYLYYLGVPAPYLILFHIGVCIGRVYFMCHWILDTIVSTILGTMIALALNKLRLSGSLILLSFEIMIDLYKIRTQFAINFNNQQRLRIMFLILHGDKPIYQFNFSKPQKLQTYFLIHASLDTIDYTIPKKRQYYIGALKVDQLPIYCYVNATGLKLLLVFVAKRQIDKKAELSIKQFLTQANKNLAIALMNPLYKQKQQIKSAIFEQKIMNLGKQYLKQFFDKKK